MTTLFVVLMLVALVSGIVCCLVSNIILPTASTNRPSVYTAIWFVVSFVVMFVAGFAALFTSS